MVNDKVSKIDNGIFVVIVHKGTVSNLTQINCCTLVLTFLSLTIESLTVTTVTVEGKATLTV